MNRLDLNIKAREIIISDRKACKMETKYLERWLAEVEACKKTIVKGIKHICVVLDSYSK